MSLTPEQLAPAAARLGVDVPALSAVVSVETAGSGLVDGRPVIRLEVHHLWREVATSKRPDVDRRFVVLGPQPWQGHRFRRASGVWVDLHQPGRAGQALEWEAFGVATEIDSTAAITASSWGLGQVLGADWARIGFPSADLFRVAQATEAGQLDTMVRYIAASDVLVRALHGHDWATFARLYNGAGKVADYAGKLASAYARAGGR